MAKTSWRSRIDRGMLRAHARLDTKRADIAISWLFALVLFVVLEWFTLTRYWSLGYGSELASSIQGFWLIGEGYWPDSTLLGESYIAQQASFIIYPLAQLFGCCLRPRRCLRYKLSRSHSESSPCGSFPGRKPIWGWALPW